MAFRVQRIFQVYKETRVLYRWNHFLTTNASCPQSLYESWVKKDVLKPDANQRRVVYELQSLFERLQEYHPTKLIKKQVAENPLVTSTASSANIDASVDEELCSNVSRPPRGLYLHGGVGSGKTMLLDMFYESVTTEHKKRVHFYSFMLYLYSEMNRWNLCCQDGLLEQDEVLPLDIIASNIVDKTWLLCFDEMQVADYGSVRLLEGLFTKMIEKGAVIVTTSNRSPLDLGSSSFGREKEARESLTSLMGTILDNCEVVSMMSEKDYRTVQKPGYSTYFQPLNSENQKHFDSAFCNEVGQGAKLNRGMLRVYGRNVVIPVASEKGIARFTFSELCQCPLGPADYITICNHYHTVFVEDIPQMNINMRNEARRFLSFIDAAYESRVNLFCSAASPPDELFQLIPKDGSSLPDNYDEMHMEMIGELAYDLNIRKLDLQSLGLLTGEDEIFSFKRCISRLKEMQTMLYQAKKHSPQLFSPYVGTKEEQLSSEARRREWEYKRRIRLQEAMKGETEVGQEPGPITPLAPATTDWADEASFTSWSNDLMRREWQQRQMEIGERKLKKQTQAPTFREEHFWGFGWWEKIIGGRNKKQK